LGKTWMKSWPQKIPQTLSYPKLSLPEILRSVAKKHPHGTALIFQERIITYKELDDLCDRFAFSLMRLGTRKGDMLALFMPNIPQFPICYFGAMRAGATVVPCSPLYRERELQFQLKDSGARTIVALDTLHSHLAPIRHKTNLKNVIVTSLLDCVKTNGEVKPARLPDTLPLGDLLKGRRGMPSKVTFSVMRDLALLQYTGGTTGVPKAAVLTHYNLVVNAVQFGSWLSSLQDGREVVLAALPLFHIFGMTTALNMPILKAESIVLVPKFEASQALKTIQRHHVTFFPGVPAMYIALINHPQISEFDLRTLRLCISGGSSLPVEVMRRFEALTNARLVEGYGLTEASPVTHCNPVDGPDRVRPGSIGLPLPDTDAKIVDIENGEKEMPVNEVGELTVRGPQVMARYWNKPDETNYALRHGWLYTGDIAKMDEEGYFHIVDRKKDMINVSGFKVWPREVEEVLYEHPAVKEAAVIGAADPRRGETVKAHIVLMGNLEVTEEQIIQFCKSKMATFKVPTKVEFAKELPKTPVGKVLRRALRN